MLSHETSMNLSGRFPCIHHCTSEPFQFFGRAAELTLLDEACAGSAVSVVAMVGPGGQGKTAIVQTWLGQFVSGARCADGVFLWSFYRGKDADLCLRELYRYVQSLEQAPDVSACYCVDHLLPVLQRERWVVVLDGTEVVQHESGSWYGRFVHPELGRLVEELASAPMPGVLIVTTRFPLPTLEHRNHAKLLSLSSLDQASAAALLRCLGVTGEDRELHEAASACGFHAKAVELLGTFLSRFAEGRAQRHRDLPAAATVEGASDEENKVARVLAAYRGALPAEVQDILALATAFRHPPVEAHLLEFLASAPVGTVLHQRWQRSYAPFRDRPPGWLAEQVNDLVALRLLERVHSGRGEGSGLVIDAHPLVRRGFESLMGSTGQQQSAVARAGFLRGRPDRRPPASLESAREEVELFHAYCDAGLWNEADGVYVALDNPKHRFLAPVFERDLLLRFFPGGVWGSPPLWPGFGRRRSLAICFELLGAFEDALLAYPPADAPLRGDALIALGRLQPLLDTTNVGQPWQNLWLAYRAHALVLAGRVEEAMQVARSLVPVDIYEWVHVFECLLRAGQLSQLDIRSVLFRPAFSSEHHWSALARRRLRLDYLRQTDPEAPLDNEFTHLLDEYDRGGLVYERALTRLSFSRHLLGRRQESAALPVAQAALDLAQRLRMPILAADALEVLAAIHQQLPGSKQSHELRQQSGYHGPGRP